MKDHHRADATNRFSFLNDVDDCYRGFSEMEIANTHINDYQYRRDFYCNKEHPITMLKSNTAHDGRYNIAFNYYEYYSFIYQHANDPTHILSEHFDVYITDENYRDNFIVHVGKMGLVKQFLFTCDYTCLNEFIGQFL